MTKFAVITTGGKQYKVTVGQVLEVEKLEKEPNSKITFDNVLMVSDKDDVKVGTPYLENTTVLAKVVEHIKSKKISGFKYKAKSRYRRRFGHRQQLTKIEIKEIK